MPRSFARRRASGEALIRPPSRWIGATCARFAGLLGPRLLALGAIVVAGRARIAFLGRLALGHLGPPPPPFVDADGFGASSPSAPITAIALPTSTSPSWTRIESRTPEASASTSCVTFSVSSS